MICDHFAESGKIVCYRVEFFLVISKFLMPEFTFNGSRLWMSLWFFKIIFNHALSCIDMKIKAINAYEHLIVASYMCTCFCYRVTHYTISTWNFCYYFILPEFYILTYINPYPTAFPYGNGMVLHFYQQQESSTTKTVHKVINKGLKTYV